MTPKAQRALAGSIKKWEGILCGEIQDLAEKNCPLCAQFIDNDCKGCPVFAKTKKINCAATPHRTQWLPALRKAPYQGGNYAETMAQKRGALAMLRFLESLR
jgi:hypothetical protein